MTNRMSEKQGFVLVSVLWVLAILTAVALGFANRAMMDRKVAWYTLDHDKALQMARGAVERGIVEIQNKGVVDAYYEQGGYTGYDQRWARPKDILKETDYYQALRGPAYEDEVCYYTIRDTGSRISINHAPEEILRELDGLNVRTIRKIMARRDPEAHDVPVLAYQSIEELRQATRIDDDAWYGTESRPGLKDLLTVWGGAININTAPAVVLRAVPDLDDSVVSAIIEYRAGNDGELRTRDDKAFENFDEMSEHLNVSAEKLSPIRKHASLTSNTFIVEGIATLRQGKVRAHVTAVVGSGYYGNPNILQWSEDSIDS